MSHNEKRERKKKVNHHRFWDAAHHRDPIIRGALTARFWTRNRLMAQLMRVLALID